MRLESSKQKSVELRTAALNFSESDFRTALTRGLVLEETLTTDLPTDRVRIVLQDRSTGFAGSISLPLTTKRE
jgi:hypothetical protein